MQPLPRLLILVLAIAALVAPGTAAAQDDTDLPRALRPAATAPFEGTSWRLRDYMRRGVARQAGPEVAAWMQLRGGRLIGSGGCTRIKGSYASIGAALKVNLGEPKPPTCGEQTTLVQLALVEGLASAVAYELQAADSARATELSIADETGAEVLRFVVDDAARLTGAEWRLEAFTVDGQRTLADPTQVAVLAFNPERGTDSRRRSSGQVVGSTGCNGVVGEYFRQADVLSFGELQTTDAPCSSQLAAQEAAILDVLNATSLAVQLPPDRLLVTSSEDGDVLELVSARPLEGTTWLLRKISKAATPAGTVTMRLRDGRVSGEGPCGSYAGDYSSDGIFITLTGLAAIDDGDCGARPAQRRFFEALAPAVLLDRSKGGLRLLDAAGKELARFDAAGTP